MMTMKILYILFSKITIITDDDNEEEEELTTTNNTNA